MSTPITGIEKIEIGLAGLNGAMGDTLVTINDIKMGTVQLEIPEYATKDVEVEDRDGTRWTLETSKPSDTFKLGTHDFSNANMILLFGGSETAGKYSPPVVSPNKYHSLKLTTRAIEGKKTVWSFPYCKITPSATIDFTKEDVSSASLTAKVLVPTDATGASLSRFSKEDVAVA